MLPCRAAVLVAQCTRITYRPFSALAVDKGRSGFSIARFSTKAGVTGEALKQRPQDTIFAKVVAGELPVDRVHETDEVLAFRDINPQAPTHVLVIPKAPLSGIGAATDRDKARLGALMLETSRVAAMLGLLEGGYRLVINEGKNGCQSVRWLHVHILGGRQLSWPPG